MNDDNYKKIDPGQINEFVRHCDNYIVGELYSWDTARRFVEGMQYGTRYRDGSWRVESTKPGMTRLTINLLLPIYQRLLATLEMTTPHVSARPSSPTKVDLVKAKADAAVVQYLWDRNKVTRIYNEAVKWLLVCGNVGIHTYFCKQSKKIKHQVVSPYDLIIQPGNSKLEDAEYIMRRSQHTKQAIKRMYPKSDPAKYKPVEFNNIYRAPNWTYTAQSYENLDMYEIIEYWDRTGNHKIISGDEELFTNKIGDGEWDPNGPWPIVHLSYHNLPGRLHGKSAIEPLMQIQREYNAQRSAIVANTKLMGNLQWLVPINSGVETINNEPGGMIRYNPAAPPPSTVGINPLPGFVMDNVVRCHSEIMDLASVHSTSMGKRTTGIESGAAINALVQQDSGQLTDVMNNIVDSAVDIAQQMLRLVKQYYPKGMMVRMFGIDGGMFYKQVKKTDLTDEPDIFIEAGTLFASSVMDRQRRAMQMFQMQLLTPEEARRAIRFFGMDEQIAQTVRFYNHALDVLEAVLSGADVEILPTDPLKEMMEVFAEYVASDEFQEVDEETQDQVLAVYRAVLAQGNPQVEQQLAQPIYPRQQQLDGMLPEGPAIPNVPGEPMAQGTSVGGTAEGAATRTENQQNAAIFENYTPRSNMGMGS